MTKTLGQIACEAHAAFLGLNLKDPFLPDSTHPDTIYLHKLWEHTAAAIAEECAKIADLYAEKAWPATDIAADIRSLKSPSSEPKTAGGGR